MDSFVLYAPTVINGIIQAASLYHGQMGMDQNEEALLQGRRSLRHDEFTSQITAAFTEVSQQTDTIVSLNENLSVVERRITAILSDYTSLLNQVSIVSTLMLGVATATFGSLLGNTDDQPQWKVNMYTISCILTICLSLYSVIESFFLSIHIYAEESRFISGVNSQYDKSYRFFDLKSLNGLSATYSSIIFTFFMSFMTFPLTLLSMTYLGLGLSGDIVKPDASRVMERSDIFLGVVPTTLDKLEYNFQSIAFSMTLLIILVYAGFLWKFFSTYYRYILWPNLCRTKCFCCVNKSLKDPMRFSAREFTRINEIIEKEDLKWRRLYEKFERETNESLTLREEYIFESFRTQLSSQLKKLKQLRKLHLTKEGNELDSGVLKLPSEEGKVETISLRSSSEVYAYHKNEIKF